MSESPRAETLRSLRYLLPEMQEEHHDDGTVSVLAGSHAITVLANGQLTGYPPETADRIMMRVTLLDADGHVVEYHDQSVVPGDSDRGSDDFPDTSAGEAMRAFVGDYAYNMTADGLAWSVVASMREEN